MRFNIASSLFATAFLLTSCASLDPDPPKTVSHSRASASNSPLAAVTQGVARSADHGQSGFQLLEGAEEAFLWRLALADSATSSIDIQYYLWSDDEAGRLLMARLIDAADRGVRVRIMVDDFLYGGDDERLAALCHHPNFEVRLFNPGLKRKGVVGPLMEYAMDFQRLNRRMHNKLFVADGHLAILGGRNIGNVYFGMGEKYNFVDLDVLTAGPIVSETSAAFDEFWNSNAAYPGEALSPEATPQDTAPAIAEFRRELKENPGVLPQTNYPLTRRSWAAEIASLESQWHYGTAMMVQDSPNINPDLERRFLDHAPSLIDPENPQELTFISPYLIPGKSTYEAIASHTSRGAHVTLLTCGLDSTNHTIVHSHYKRHRVSLLQAGSALFEFRGNPSEEVRKLSDVSPVRGEFVVLHVKGGVGDRKMCYIGSLNLDPRSVKWNTENGLIIDSPSLSREVADLFDFLMDPANSWEVVPNAFDAIRWESDTGTKFFQPSNGPGRRVNDILFGLLPVAGQL